MIKAIIRCKEDQDKLREAQKKRSAQYGIAVKSDTQLTLPAEYPANAVDYGDPVNYRYPLDEEWLQASRAPATKAQGANAEVGAFTTGA